MPLLKVEAEKLSQNEMVSGIIEEIIERDDLFSVLPFTRINGKAYVYHRETANGVTAAGSSGALPSFLDPNDTVPEGAAEFLEIITKLRIIAGDVDVDKFLQEVESDTNDQLSIQIGQKAKALGRIYHDALVNGDSTVNTKQFDGLRKISSDIGGAQTINAGTNGGSLTLSMLDQLLDSVLNGADVILMRRGTLRAFRNLLRAASGTSAAEYMMPAFGRPMLTHNGVPIIVNDFLPANETLGTGTGLCSIYALRTNEADGIHGLYGGSNAGIRVESVGTVQNKDADRVRLKWYAGLALKSTKSIGRLQGVTNV